MLRQPKVFAEAQTKGMDLRPRLVAAEVLKEIAFSPDGKTLVITVKDKLWWLDLSCYDQAIANLQAERDSATMPTTSLLSEIDSDTEVRAKALNDRAWALATSPDLQTRDPHTAVELALEAVKLIPITADCRTVGIHSTA